LVDPCKNSFENDTIIPQDFFKNSTRIPQEFLQEEEATGYWSTIRIRLQTSTKYVLMIRVQKKEKKLIYA
jgi:hypothetical protein